MSWPSSIVSRQVVHVVPACVPVAFVSIVNPSSSSLLSGVFDAGYAGPGDIDTTRMAGAGSGWMLSILGLLAERMDVAELVDQLPGSPILCTGTSGVP